jgi:hypothetical protein
MFLRKEEEEFRISMRLYSEDCRPKFSKVSPAASLAPNRLYEIAAPEGKVSSHPCSILYLFDHIHETLFRLRE